ncbi:MAG: carbohydrate-binding domain-containing protein [Prevotella sp.]|nr:carbohydrate-binding domain-containing protein [Prevotella sp.]
MKKILLWVLPFLMGSICHAEDITIRYKGATAKVSQQIKDSVKVTVNGASVNIESLYEDHKLTILLTGKSDNGQLILKTAGKAKVKLDGLTLTSQEGAPLDLRNKKKVEVVAVKGTDNTLTITACNDTANHKAATIWAKGKLEFSGKGKLNVIATGDGCRGIKTKKDITIEDLTLNITTSGNNLGEKPFGFGGGFPGGGFPGFGDGEMPDFGGGFPGGGFPNFGGGMPPFGNDSIRAGGFPNFGGDMPNFGGGFPGGGFPGGGFPDFCGMRPEDNDSTSEGGFGGFGGKHKYVASTKGIASKGKITINSGNITVKTSTPGAEGIEGKEGIVFNGGNIDVLATDDAINANATIEFNGGRITARSTTNDAVDSNPKGGFFMPFGGNNNNQDIDPAIIIRGGTVYAWSQVGSPEEGLDCDFAPFVIEGGTIFSVGGGMGEMPSVPSNEDAKQPTVLLIGINIVKDEPVSIYDADGKLIDTVTIPFSMRRSASLVGSPAFKLGNTYTVKTKGYEKTFTLSEPFTAVR